MPSFKCKKCKAKNTIPNEWIELGISRVVTCNSCGYKMNLNLSKSTKQQKPGTQILDNLQSHSHQAETPRGTKVEGVNSEVKSNSYSLEVIEGRKQKMHLDLEHIESTHHIFVGRNPASKKSMDINDAAWVIDDPYVSRLHCQFTISKQSGRAKFILQDAGSVNGTIINQIKLESGDQVLLNIGDQILIGDTKILFKKN